MTSRHEDPLIQDDFDPSMDQPGDEAMRSSRHSSGRYADLDGAQDAGRSRRQAIFKVILFSLAAGVFVATGLYFWHVSNATPPAAQPVAAIQPLPPKKLKHPSTAVLPKDATLLPVGASTSAPPADSLAAVKPGTAINPATGLPFDAKVASPAVAASAPVLSAPVLSAPVLTTTPLASSPAVASSTTPVASAPVAVVPAHVEAALVNAGHADAGSDPLFARTPVAPVSSPLVTSTPVTSTPVVQGAVSTPVMAAPVLATPGKPALVVTPAVAVPASSPQLDHISGQIGNLDHKVDALGQRVTRLEENRPAVNPDQAPTTRASATKAEAKAADARNTMPSAKPRSHKAAHAAPASKNSIEILSESTRSGNRIRTAGPAALPKSAVEAPGWSGEGEQTTYTFSAVKDGRAWIKSADGSFVTVMTGTVLPDGRKVTKVDDDSVWIDGKKISR
jgi:hypothetical protein